MKSVLCCVLCCVLLSGFYLADKTLSTTDVLPLYSTSLSLVIEHMKNIRFQEFVKTFH